MSRLSILTKGIIKENPVLVFLLGMCPSLAVSAQVSSAVGMGIATTFVLVCSNALVSLLRRSIPDKVRVPCYIVLIASLVTVVQMFVEAYAYSLYLALGIFLPLITVNCIILARAEVFAGKNTVVNSVLDALGMGAGFTLALFSVASIREIIGSGTWYGFSLPVPDGFNIPLMTMAPGGFAALGLLIAIVNKVSGGKAARAKQAGCAGCPSALACGKAALEKG